jgi:hypothetical protein
MLEAVDAKANARPTVVVHLNHCFSYATSLESEYVRNVATRIGASAPTVAERSDDFLVVPDGFVPVTSRSIFFPTRVPSRASGALSAASRDAQVEGAVVAGARSTVELGHANHS